MKLINDEGLEKFGQYVTNEYANEEETTDTLSALENEIDDHTHTASAINEIGDLNALETTETTTLVGAINELYNTFNNKGKELIANAVGEPLQSTDSFQGLSNDINDLLNQFKSNMMNAGVAVESKDKFKALIDKIEGLTEGEGNKGIRYARGESVSFLDNVYKFSIDFSELSFTPSLIIATTVWDSVYVPMIIYTTLDTGIPEGKYFYTQFVNTAEGTQNLPVGLYEAEIYDNVIYFTSGAADRIYIWHAFGVGEEDTTLRDSLANILEDEGVEITEEDDMANLIVKTDKEFADNTNKLYEIMNNGGYEVNDNMNLDALLDILEKSGIFINEIKQIACGDDFTFILKNNGSLWACGKNEYGQLGLSDTTQRTTLTKLITNINNDVKQIVCGYDHTFILKNDGSVWSCGLNSTGALGLGGSTNKSVFTKVTTNINNDVKQIVCGYDYTFILKNDGSVWSCGRNSTGGLGLGNYNDKLIFTQVTTNINNDVAQIACGRYHTIILKNDGSVWSCGSNSYGELGLGDTSSRATFTQATTDVKQIACGDSHTYILKNDGSLWACGHNSNGELGLGHTSQRNTFTQVTTNTNNDVKQIICGHLYIFILKNDGSLWSCGRNSVGQLGLGDTTDRTTFTQVTTNINNDVKQIACGGYHTYILKNDDSVWSCGYNANGQLGLDHTTNKLTLTEIIRGF